MLFPKAQMSNFISEFTLKSLSSDRQSDALPFYHSALRYALEKHPPPYGKAFFGKEFRDSAKDPAWVANLLISDVDLEGYSSKQLWLFASTIQDELFSQGVTHHALDEAKHSRIFASILFTLFPKATSENLRRQVISLIPAPFKELSDAGKETLDKRSFDETLHTAILINLYETKALILGHLIQPIILAYSNPGDQKRLKKVTDTLLMDEIRHIRYSASFLEKAAANGHGDAIYSGMEEFQSVLNDITIADLSTANRHRLNPLN